MLPHFRDMSCLLFGGMNQIIIMVLVTCVAWRITTTLIDIGIDIINDNQYISIINMVMVTIGGCLGDTT
jgi:hypothetical protein